MIKPIQFLGFAVIMSLMWSSCFDMKLQDLSQGRITDYEFDGYSIRAIQVIDDQKFCFTGNNNVFGITHDQGESWTVSKINKDTANITEFRSIAFNGKSLFVLSISNPALLYKSDDLGKSWNLVYEEVHEKVFYDAMTFQSELIGYAMGDPTENCLSVIKTLDGGNTWKKISCGHLPVLAEKEFAFAASNTNIVATENSVWMVSGGMQSRVFKSNNRGESWAVFPTPMIGGGEMTGIFSLAMADDEKGIVFGGDWNDKENNSKNKAITLDGGKTWKLVSNNEFPGYRSCVQYVPNTKGMQLIATGIPGSCYSMDGGLTWLELNKDADFYTVRVSKNLFWFAGKGKVRKINIK